MKYLGYLILLFSLCILYHLLNLATIGKKGHCPMLPDSGVASRRRLKQGCQSWPRTYSPCSGSWAESPIRVSSVSSFRGLWSGQRVPVISCSLITRTTTSDEASFLGCTSYTDSGCIDSHFNLFLYTMFFCIKYLIVS